MTTYEFEQKRLFDCVYSLCSFAWRLTLTRRDVFFVKPLDDSLVCVYLLSERCNHRENGGGKAEW